MVATSVLSAVPLALCFGLASPLLGTVFGAEYERFAPLLMAVVIGQWVLRLAGVGLSLAALYALHEEAYVLRASALAAAVNIGLDCILIPLLGMYGAVVATALAATLAGALLQRRLTLRTTAKWPTRQLAQLTVASVLLAVGALIAASTASWRGIPIVLFSLAIWAFSMHRAAILEPITRRIPRRIQT